LKVGLNYGLIIAQEHKIRLSGNYPRRFGTSRYPAGYPIRPSSHPLEWK